MDEPRSTYYSEEALDKKLTDLINEKLSEGCLVLEEGVNQITLEILISTDDYIFARLGKMQDIKTVHLRNKKTLEASPIERAIDQEIEIFTYLIINRKNMIITYITEQGAPHIYAIEKIAKRYFKESEFLEVTPIMVPDALEVLKNKKTISKMDYKITLPTNELLNMDNLNLPIDDIVNIKDLKTATLQITITGQKGKNIISNIKENLADLVQRIKGNEYGKAKQISFNAKNDNEYTHTYNVFDEFFVRKTRMNTRNIDIKIRELDFNDESYYENVQRIIHEEIKIKLLSVYTVNEVSLEDYIKVT